MSNNVPQQADCEGFALKKTAREPQNILKKGLHLFKKSVQKMIT